MTRRGILTVTIAVLGLALSAALAWSASQLAGQRIGLASEPLSVERGLAPEQTAVRPATPSHRTRGKRHPRPGPKPTVAPKPASTPASTGSQIFTTPAPTATSAAPPPTAPVAVTTTPAPTSASGGRSSSGAGGRRDDHRADD